MPEFWRHNSKRHRKLSRAEASLEKQELVDYHRNLTPKSSYSSSYSAKDFTALLAQERALQKQLQRVETQDSIQPFNPLRRSQSVLVFNPLGQSPPSPPPPVCSDVLVVGAGPAGLMLV